MKLGSQTNSLTNHILSRATINQPKPIVGMGATLLSWTDRHAATVIAVYEFGGGYDVVVQEDKAVRTDNNGMSESQEYSYTPNPDGSKRCFRFENKIGKWRETFVKPNGRVCLVKGGGYGLRIGEREKYHDFSF